MEDREQVVMQALAMNGPHPLTDDAVDAVVTRTSPGNYALGYLDGSTFLVFYVGRADRDVRARLHEWVGEPSPDHYAPAAKAPWMSRCAGIMPLAVPAFGPVGGDADSGYTHFAFSYAPSAEAAYAKEWSNYEEFGRGGDLDNPLPPHAREAFVALR